MLGTRRRMAAQMNALARTLSTDIAALSSTLCVDVVRTGIRADADAMLAEQHALVWRELALEDPLGHDEGRFSTQRVPKLWTHQTEFYDFCDQSVREKAWPSRNRVSRRRRERRILLSGGGRRASRSHTLAASQAFYAHALLP